MVSQESVHAQRMHRKSLPNGTLIIVQDCKDSLLGQDTDQCINTSTCVCANDLLLSVIQKTCCRQKNISATYCTKNTFWLKVSSQWRSSQKISNHVILVTWASNNCALHKYQWLPIHLLLHDIWCQSLQRNQFEFLVTPHVRNQLMAVCHWIKQWSRQCNLVDQVHVKLLSYWILTCSLAS